MAKKEQYDKNVERELGEILLSVPAKEGPREICPTPATLRCFVAGATEKVRNEVLNHLAVCPKCVDMVAQLSTQRTLIRRSFVAVACFVFAAILWIWNSGPRSLSIPVATVDLRFVAPTRGNESENVAPTQVGADTRQVVIILPESREDGAYEVEVRATPGNTPPVLHRDASVIVKDHTLQLNVSLDFSRLAPGKYVLAVRHAGLAWEYVPLLRK